MQTPHADRITTLFAALALLVLLAPIGAARAEDWRLSVGADYSSGDYGLDRDTDILYLPLTLRYRNEAWTAKLTVSHLTVTGPGGVLADGTVIDPNASRRRDTESGLGDTWLSLGYALPAAAGSNVYYDLVGKLKLATADEDQGLGTGETDAALQIEAFVAGQRFSPFATLGYKVTGDPAGTEYNDVLYLSLGLDARAGDEQSLGLIYDFRQASTDGIDDVHEMTAYLNRRWDQHWSSNVYAVLGLSDNSPDYALGLQVSHDF